LQLVCSYLSIGASLPFIQAFKDMSRQHTWTKRARTEQQDGAGGADNLPGREQLLLTSPELQTRVGLIFVDESELVPLLLAHGLIRRVRTIQIEVRPLGGDSFKVTLNAAKATVGRAKAEIARSQGTAEARQELYKIAERADGLAVREDDAEPEPLEDESMGLEDGNVVAMAVKEMPLLWRTFAEDRVTLSEGGAVATQTMNKMSLTTTQIELTEDKHYWEVELTLDYNHMIFIGISRPNLDPTGIYYQRHCTDGWFMYAENGGLCGNGKYDDDVAGAYKQGDRIGILLDLDNGSLRFFKNGVKHGPGYAAGSVTGPVVAAVQMYSTLGSSGRGVRLLPNAEVPAGA
jgi:hypothetical protein